MKIHPSAYVHADAVVHPSCELGPNVVIDGPAHIGPDCRIGPSAIILGHTEIGSGCTIHSHAVVGDVPQDHKYRGDLSYCRIGRDCVIREGVTIHRASVQEHSTIVGDRCYLMTNSHVAHDCILSDDVTLVSGALLGGHVQIGRKAIISGNTGVHQFVRIGAMTMIGAVAMISQDIPPYVMTNHNGEIAGLNAIGLIRADISREERQEVKALFKVIYRSGMALKRAVELAAELAKTDAGRQFIEFFDSESLRGIRKYNANGRQRIVA
ncbi:Acyl-[acyl-carrier-protein]--UDP-N-acetylglucosamine O-acyltransferase [Polystyrenella longa]|uniref:Acyl-[acyl-carrier-protein]--UDP-N-acetylglucosamine O-acyltransferase n=1 Tax=Polystyrenella longa TaxID=2528007 RepID=A0A518CH17_9PLAN|nr:acyl-ACP--UDP-N-acetylglucosamine O-acyltransferase [Polystyrenella longa]QDU78520.1 Acyl-[acyl-carrier-protein]--UDP-N-acetylglucosamine O-acyltransferase [Polystyrenella longa]